MREFNAKNWAEELLYAYGKEDMYVSVVGSYGTWCIYVRQGGKTIGCFDTCISEEADQITARQLADSLVAALQSLGVRVGV